MTMLIAGVFAGFVLVRPGVNGTFVLTAQGR